MEQIFNQFMNSIGGSLSSVMGAILFFLVFWIIALIAASFVRKLLTSMNVNGRVNQSSSGKGLDIERLVSRLVFWFVLLFGITGALNKMNLDMVSAPLANMLNQVTSSIPNFIFAIVLALVGWLIATLARSSLQAVLNSTDIDERLSADAGVPPLSNTLSNLLYWLILLLFIPMVLEKLGMQGLLEPVTNLVDKIITFLPNLFIGGVIAFVGYIVARILRGLATNIVATLNVDSLLQKSGVQKTNLANIAGMVVFLFVMVPTIIAALQALQVEAISRPATNMLNTIMTVLPSILFALVLLAGGFYLSRFVANIISSILENTSVNDLPTKLGIADVFGETKVSSLVGNLIIFFAMLFVLILSVDMLGLERISDVLTSLISFGGYILLGSFILMVGFWLANFVANIIKRGENGSVWLATLVRVLIMGLVAAMGLRAMNVANEIVELAFGLTLGSVAVAFALAFGLGGREAAARVLKGALDKIDQEKANK